jgi:hypothetical protein
MHQYVCKVESEMEKGLKAITLNDRGRAPIGHVSDPFRWRRLLVLTCDFCIFHPYMTFRHWVVVQSLIEVLH